ncbi:MAG: hypothetical protein COW32_08000 [Candidatus Aquicultor secundus]|uniref:Uncharacterized protein n=1 Tax=Candidatus Aquicultor secundus TaxID=1973895 RepID=A0A2M7T6H3_9ACTN|nr:hypothetical protein [Solirubrobacter sp.]PIU26719.1 MAG: hypothetical protein COT10_07255 [Candidatus Aquicultor secundus]PIW21776.1 MAG: hypothetical protein COW32_08000 [Candidatus Aquicultor secundus]PIX53202.1 MAG: hypothetical protein COZ51_00060 [Candidatus Aquicultor secundus]PIY38337.1 MAG: hypothetical protein COZ03_08390 [Candidatus Aquicultor secundus]
MHYDAWPIYGQFISLVHKWDYRFFYRELNSLINNDDGLKKSFIALQERQITAIDRLFLHG